MTSISAGELKLHWGILDFELLKFIRNGLSAYDRFGRRTITESQVEYEKDETLSELRQRLYLRERKHETQRIEKNNSAEYRANAQLLGIELPPPETYDDKIIYARVEKRIMEEYDQLPSFRVVPRDRRLIPAELNDNDLEALLDEIKTFHFTAEDINIFAELNGLKLIGDAYSAIEQANREAVEREKTGQLKPEGKQTPQQAQANNIDHEEFIRSLEISYVSDTEIKIRGGGNKSKIYGMKDLGFLKEKSKAWNAFILILNSKDHRYHVGAAHGAKRKRKTSYDIGQKVLFELNKKFVPFFNKIYPLQLPEKYKVYELIPGKTEAPGTYRFKFQIKTNHDAAMESFNVLPKDQLLQKIGEISEEYKKLSKRGSKEAETQLEGIKGNLYSAVEIALKKEWLTRNRVLYYINERSDDSPNIVYPKKVEGRWINDINDSSPDEHSIEDDESSQED